MAVSPLHRAIEDCPVNQGAMVMYLHGSISAVGRGANEGRYDKSLTRSSLLQGSRRGERFSPPSAHSSHCRRAGLLQLLYLWHKELRIDFRFR